MKTLLIAVSCCCVFVNANAQQIIEFHIGNTVDQYSLSEGDSIYFDESHATLYFFNNGNTQSYETNSIDSITFANDLSANIFVNFNESDVSVVNPYAGSGVEVDVVGAHVVVNSVSLDQDINYVLTGVSSNGSFKIYSEKRFNVLLNGLHLTNPIGPALNIQSDKKATLHLISGSSNELSDGAVYAAPPVVDGLEEDQKSTLFANGQLEMIGGGSLSIFGIGAGKHALACDDELDFREGTLNIESAMLDGIHTNNGYYQRGGDIDINSSADGIDTESGAIQISCGELSIASVSNDVSALSSDSTIFVTGGLVQLLVSGSSSKGINADMGILISGGSIEALSSGNAALVPTGSGNDPKYSSILSSDGNIFITGGELDLLTSGIGGRAISGNQSVVISGGTVDITTTGNGATYTNSTGTTDAYHSTSIKVDVDCTISGGTTTISNSGTGGKGIDVDGNLIIGGGNDEPVLNVTTTGSSITITSGGGGGGPGGNNGTYDESKTIKVDGDVTIHSGQITLDSADDGIKSGGTVTIHDGQLQILDSYEAIEAPFITVNGGDVSLVSTDDGFNATHGTGGESSDGSLLAIHGGQIFVDASDGDPVDSNGNVTITGGVTAVHGPQSSPEVGMDYNGTALISGGFIVISGTNSNMTEGFGSASAQRSMLLKTTQSIAANTIFYIQDSDGNELLTFKPKRSYYSIVFSSPEITAGTSYTVYTAGSSTGTNTNGLYEGGSYTPGNQETTFIVNGIVTTANF